MINEEGLCPCGCQEILSTNVDLLTKARCANIFTETENTKTECIFQF